MEGNEEDREGDQGEEPDGQTEGVFQQRVQERQVGTSEGGREG